jgi:TonB family protein
MSRHGGSRNGIPDTPQQVTRIGCGAVIGLEVDGRAKEVTLKKSTGFAALDQACLHAVEQAEFVPARQFGVKFAAWTDIEISWRLPSQ